MFLFGEALPPEHYPEATQNRNEQENAGGFRNGVLDDGNIIQSPLAGPFFSCPLSPPRLTSAPRHRI
jgi:hypothetical protein